MLVKLIRYSYAETETEGHIKLSTGEKFATIEQPWRRNPNGAPGGKPYESCIPDGMYELFPFTRPNEDADQVWMIFNPDKGVYKFEDDLPEPGKGRFLCLIHKANWSHQIRGCVAPGMVRKPMPRPMDGEVVQAVSQSGQAMNRLLGLLGTETRHILSIETRLAFGAKDA